MTIRRRRSSRAATSLRPDPVPLLALALVLVHSNVSSPSIFLLPLRVQLLLISPPLVRMVSSRAVAGSPTTPALLFLLALFSQPLSLPPVPHLTSAVGRFRTKKTTKRRTNSVTSKRSRRLVTPAERPALPVPPLVHKLRLALSLSTISNTSLAPTLALKLSFPLFPLLLRPL
jgi:hypothetical protein